LKKGVWFQGKIFDHWPDNDIDIFVDKTCHVLVPKKADYEKLPAAQKQHHNYLLESVRKYDLLYHRGINHCSACNMFAGRVHEFIVCRYQSGVDISSCLDYDKL